MLETTYSNLEPGLESNTDLQSSLVKLEENKREGLGYHRSVCDR
jgi:hypothetical protein